MMATGVTRVSAIVAAILTLAPAAAMADGYLTAEVPAAVAVSTPQDGVFRTGAMPAVGLYQRLTSNLAVGLRLRAGLLRDGAAPAVGMKDPAIGGLGTGAVALRLGAAGAWAELAGGAGLTGSDFVPAIEAGVGFEFAVAGVRLGPTVRYAHVGVGNSMGTFGAADLVLFGLEATFGGEPAQVVAPPPSIWAQKAAPPAAPPPVPPEAVASDPDHDAIVDGDERCPVEGCVGTASFVVKDDRIVVPERVLFDLNSARVKHSGRDVIREFAKVLRDHPDWTHVTIEGHADVRGPEAYNATLSQSRADHVRDVLVRAGITPERIDAVGFGSTRPAVAGDDAGALQRNRRVEFVLTHGTPRGVQ